MARPTSRVTKVHMGGPLAPFAAAYRSRLQESDYTPLTIVNELRQVAHLSRWMECSQLAVNELTTGHLQQFLAPRRAEKGHRGCSFRGLAVMLDVLSERGVLPDPITPPQQMSAYEVVLEAFHSYLLAERGLVAGTAEAYLARARRFLAGCGCEIADLSPGDVTRAVQLEATRVSIGSTQYFVAGVRSFLRFCFIHGLVNVDLSAAALSVTGRRHSSLPRGISSADASALLRSCDRRRCDGRRDYAMLVVLLRLGLRAGEVAGLTLDDIDWRAGEIEVRGKGRRLDRLPMPADVGEAIAGYLRRGRPTSTRREVFLRALAPIGPLGRGGVSSIVRRACSCAGVAPVGAHRLRHTLACDMVGVGVPLSEIAQVLRHRSISSTAIYARVDLGQLRNLAQPWPGGDGR